MHSEPTTPIVARVLRVRRGGIGAVATVAALACAALMSACGSSSTSSTSSTSTKILNTARVAASIEQSILKERHLSAKVICPTTVVQEAGKTFQCVATSTATKAPFVVTKTPFVVTIQNSKGYVTYVGK
jgi:hypothetical protein